MLISMANLHNLSNMIVLFFNGIPVNIPQKKCSIELHFCSLYYVENNKHHVNLSSEQGILNNAAVDVPGKYQFSIFLYIGK